MASPFRAPRPRPTHGLLGPEGEVRFSAHENYDTAAATELAIRRSEVKALKRAARMAYRALEPWPEAQAALGIIMPFVLTPEPKT